MARASEALIGEIEASYAGAETYIPQELSTAIGHIRRKVSLSMCIEKSNLLVEMGHTVAEKENLLAEYEHRIQSLAAEDSQFSSASNWQRCKHQRLRTDMNLQRPWWAQPSPEDDHAQVGCSANVWAQPSPDDDHEQVEAAVRGTIRGSVGVMQELVYVGAPLLKMACKAKLVYVGAPVPKIACKAMKRFMPSPRV